MFLYSREGGISNFHLAGLRAVQVLLSIYVWRILGGQGGTFVSVLSLSCFHKKYPCFTRRVKKLLLSFTVEAQLIKSKGRTKVLICCSWMTLLVGAGLAGGR